MITLSDEELTTLLSYLQNIKGVIQDYAGELSPGAEANIAVKELIKISHMVEKVQELLESAIVMMYGAYYIHYTDKQHLESDSTTGQLIWTDKAELKRFYEKQYNRKFEHDPLHGDYLITGEHEVLTIIQYKIMNGVKP